MGSVDDHVGRHPSSEEVEAESACRAIIYGVCDFTDGVDGKRPTERLHLFSDTCVYITTNRPGQPIEGKEALIAYLAEREEFVMNARYRHIVTNVHFALDDPKHASTRSTLTTFSLNDPQPFLPNAIQELRDEFVLEDDGYWRIARREYFDLARRDK